MCCKFKRRVFSLPDSNLMKLSCHEVMSFSTDESVYDSDARKSFWQSRVDHLTNISADSKMILQNIYSCLWANLISNQTCDGKLRTYSKLKKNEMENYVVTVPFQKRKNIYSSSH